MSLRAYLSAFHDSLGFLGTWLPNQRIAVGDVGTLKDGVFRRVTSLEQLEIPFKLLRGRALGDLEHSSGAGVSFGAGAGASGTPTPGIQANGRASMKFEKSGGFYIRARGCAEELVADGKTLADAILERFQDGAWEKDWVVIDRVVRAESATIVVCAQAGGSLELSAAATTGPFDLADAKLGIQAASWSGEMTRFVAEAGLIPLYQVRRVRAPWFGEPSLESTGFREAGEAELVVVSPEEALG